MSGSDQNTGQPSEELDGLAISVAGAMAQQYAQDSRTFLGHLARFLLSALGEAAVTVKRSGLFGGDNRPVKRIEFTLSEEGGKASRYVIEDTTGRGSVVATRAQIVHNIALRTDPMPMDKWIETVGVAIAAEAERGKAARDALRLLL